MKNKVVITLVVVLASLAMFAALTIVFSQSNLNTLGAYEEVIGGVVNYHETRFRDDPRNIYIVNKKTDSKILIYRSPRNYVDWISVSPNRTFIAGIEPSDSIKNSLLIIDPKGKVLYSIDDDVRKYAWSPTGDRIAYITGTYREGKLFKTTGVYIFDLKDGGKKQIIKDFPHPTIKDFEGGGYDITWALHDSNIYIQEFEPLGGNYMYDTKTEKTEKIPYGGIHFSPDGKYYLALSSMEYPRVYMSSANEEITEQVKSRLGYVPWNWMSDQKHHMLAVEVDFEPSALDSIGPGKPKAMKKVERKIRQKTYFVYDVEKDQIIKEWVEKP